MHGLNMLFTQNGILKSASGKMSSAVLRGNVFVKPNCLKEEKSAAVNIAARLGFEAAAFNLSVIRIYEGEKSVSEDVNIFIGCGLFFDENASGVTIKEKDGKTYITLKASDAKEVYALGLKNTEETSFEHTANQKIPDLSEIFSENGILKDIDGDFLPDFLDAKIFVPDCSDDDLVALGNIAAKLGSETAGMLFPVTACDENYKGTLICFKGSDENSVSLQNTENGARINIFGKGAANCFVKSGDFKNITEQSTEFLKDALNGKGFFGQCVAVAEKAKENAEAYFDETTDLNKKAAEEFLKSQTDATVSVKSYKDGRTVFEIEKEFLWECDRLTGMLESEIYPKLEKGANVKIMASVSEEKEVRNELKKKIENGLKDLGVCADVTIISSFKQGLSFVEECIIPKISERVNDIKEVVIGFKPFMKSEDEEWDAVSGAMPIYAKYGSEKKWFDLPIRWLQELYPVDDIIFKSTGFDKENVKFEKLEFNAENTYTFRAYGKDGGIIFDESFNAAFYERNYLGEFPNSGLVHPHENFLKVYVDGKKIADKRFETDLDLFWEFFQFAVLSECGEYINRIYNENPRKENQPFFKCLRFDIFASEPDYRLGIREDSISSLDFLHEDIYFTSLDYFRVWGENISGEPFTEPGLVLPFIEKRNGKGLYVKVELTVNAQAEPCFVSDKKIEIDVSENPVKLVKYFTEENRVTKLVFNSETDISRSIALKKFVEGYSPKTGLEYCGEIEINHASGETVKIKFNEISDVCAEKINFDAENARMENEVIGYDDYIELTKKLKVAGVNVWKASSSYQNRDIYAYDFTEDINADVVSRIKQITYKPSLLICNRHHANEVSSTNSAYQLIFKLMNDAETKKYLEDMNIVILPFENVDGGFLGYELQKQNPNWILHVARFNAAGRDFYHDYFIESKYGESYALPRTYFKWLPDFLTDNHGVPSHEWAQPYSGYVSPWFKGFWLPRGIFYGICTYVDSPKYPGFKALFDKVADYTAELLNGDSEIKKLNAELKYVHSKYAHDWMPNMYAQDYVNDLIYYFKGVPEDPKSRNAHIRFPNVTSMEWITEISDETAQGDYMRVCAKTHHLADLGTLNLLKDIEIDIQNKAVTVAGGEVYVTKIRKRPLTV